jgi:hypothetical protein
MANGGIVYVDQATRRVTVTNGTGTMHRRLPASAALNDRPAWSPDGTRIAVGNRILDAAGTVLSTLPFPVADPSWSPDGTQLAFRSEFFESTGPDPDQQRTYGPLAIAPADGSANPTPLGPRQTNGYPAWTPDSTSVAYSKVSRGATAREIVRHHLLSGHEPAIVPPQPDLPELTMAAWAPGGFQLAFALIATPTDGIKGRIALANGDGTGLRILVASEHLLTFPTWSPDGQFLAYTQIRSQSDEGIDFSDSAIMVIPAGGGTPFQVAAGSGPSWTTTRDSTVTVTTDAAPLTVGDSIHALVTIASTGNGAPVPGLGPVAITVDGVFDQTVQLDLQGQAPVRVLADSGGQHHIAVLYDGDGELGPGTGEVTVTVAKARSNLSISTSPNPAAPGDPVTARLVVTGIPGVIPSGTLRVFVGLTQVGTTAANAPTPVVLRGLTAGLDQPVFATYDGDTRYTTAFSNIVQQDITVPTRTTLTADPDPTVFGQPARYTASVSRAPSAPAGPPPTGAVTFHDATSTLAIVPLTAGTATMDRALPAGTHQLIGSYPGDGTTAGSTSDPVTVSVAVADSITTLEVTLDRPGPRPPLRPRLTVPAGEPVHLAATVTGRPPSAGTPNGRIRYTKTTAEPGTADQLLGEIVFDPRRNQPIDRLDVTFTPADAGTVRITAHYLGNQGFNPSNDDTTITVTTPTGPTPG